MTMTIACSLVLIPRFCKWDWKTQRLSSGVCGEIVASWAISQQVNKNPYNIRTL